jgi:hypothetical protein
MTERRYISDMRQRLGLKPDDTSRDADIEKMSPKERLALIAGWHLGYRGWEHTILNWVQDAGFKLTPSPRD